MLEQGLVGDRKPCGGADHGQLVMLNRDARTGTSLVLEAMAPRPGPCRVSGSPHRLPCLWVVFAKNKFPLEPGCLCPGSAARHPLGERSPSGPHVVPCPLAVVSHLHFSVEGDHFVNLPPQGTRSCHGRKPCLWSSTASNRLEEWLPGLEKDGGRDQRPGQRELTAPRNCILSVAKRSTA